MARVYDFIGTFNDIVYYKDSYEVNMNIFVVVLLTDGFECPACRKLLNIDCDKVLALPKNLALENIVTRYVEERRRSMCLSQSAASVHNDTSDHCAAGAVDCGVTVNSACDLCDSTAGPASRAAWFCVQCNVAYCTACLGKFHPQRGVLARHCLQSVADDGTKVDDAVRLAFCTDHASELASMFCDRCKLLVCHLCVCDGEGRHAGHKMLLPQTACTIVKVLSYDCCNSHSYCDGFIL